MRPLLAQQGSRGDSESGIYWNVGRPNGGPMKSSPPGHVGAIAQLWDYCSSYRRDPHSGAALAHLLIHAMGTTNEGTQ